MAPEVFRGVPTNVSLVLMHTVCRLRMIEIFIINVRSYRRFTQAFDGTTVLFLMFNSSD